MCHRQRLIGEPRNSRTRLMLQTGRSRPADHTPPIKASKPGQRIENFRPKEWKVCNSDFLSESTISEATVRG
jgi:hypothetical protein